jgi:sugar/nucleoside kinase (ribokinase family)
MSLLVVGSVALDTVSTPKGKIDDGLGGSATYFSIAASMFTKVHVVGIVGTDFPKEHIGRLRAKNIDVDGLCTLEGKTFRWCGRYDDDFGDPETLDTQLNVFANFSPQLPAQYTTLPYLFLGNIHPLLQMQVLDQIASPKLVALDTMNYWITRERDALLAVFQKIDTAVINELEVRMLTGERSIPIGMRMVQKLGPKNVIVKRGPYGVICIFGDEIFQLTAYPTDGVIDPTGAGDSFAGGMMGYLASQNDLSPQTFKQAVAYGTVVGSFCVEGFSVERLESISRTNLDSRFESLRAMSKF